MAIFKVTSIPLPAKSRNIVMKWLRIKDNRYLKYTFAIKIKQKSQIDVTSKDAGQRRRRRDARLPTIKHATSVNRNEVQFLKQVLFIMELLQRRNKSQRQRLAFNSRPVLAQDLSHQWSSYCVCQKSQVYFRVGVFAAIVCHRLIMNFIHLFLFLYYKMATFLHSYPYSAITVHS